MEKLGINIKPGKNGKNYSLYLSYKTLKRLKKIPEIKYISLSKLVDIFLNDYCDYLQRRMKKYKFKYEDKLDNTEFSIYGYDFINRKPMDEEENKKLNEINLDEINKDLQNNESEQFE